MAGNASTTNPTLVRAIRERLGPQSDEELLRTWTENDRVNWSAETFDAIRLILIDRGVALPPQGEPPPMARRQPMLVEERSAMFWSRLVLPVLWIGVVLGALGIVRAVAQFRDQFAMIHDALVRYPLYTPATAVHLFIEFGLPLWLVLGSLACMLRRRGFRRALVLYSWFAIAAGAYGVFAAFHQIYSRFGTGIAYPVMSMEQAAQAAVFPVILLLVLLREDARVMLEPRSEGFEPTTMRPE